MGSRPTRVRSMDMDQEDVNGSGPKGRVNELQDENTRLQQRVTELERSNPEELVKENDRLKKQNEDLRNELMKLRRATDEGWGRSLSFPVKTNSDLSASNIHHDVYSDNMNLTPSPTTDRKILSDRSSSPGCSSCKTSPNVNDGRKRKIAPNSVLQRMSDIDAYGQGIPLADSSLMVKNVRRTRHRKRKTTTTVPKDDSPTNSDGTASPADVLPNEIKITRNESKSGEEGQADSGVHSTDVEHQNVDGSQETNDILMT